MALNQPYQHQPTAIASYSYTDIEANTGIVQYYITAGTESGGTTYDLVETAYNSWFIEVGNAQTLTCTTGEFNTPRIVKGTAFFSGNIHRRSNADGGTNANMAVKIQHYDGTTATDISGTITSGTLTNTAGETKSVFLKIPITVEKQVKKGDSIRVLVTGTGTNGVMGTSPTNQTSPSGLLANTQMIIGIPFNLDL